MNENEQEYQPSFEEQLINRLANRIGVASAQVDALQLQLEAAHARIAQLEAQIGHDPEPPNIGDAMEGHGD